MHNDTKNCILKKYSKIDVSLARHMGKVDWLKRYNDKQVQVF